jgi:HK97 family phage portal protein
LGILTRAIRGHAASGVTNPQGWLVDMLGGSGSSTGLSVTESTALTSTAVYACVKILAETIGSLPVHVYQEKPDGSKVKATDHPLYPVLHLQPNPEMTTQEWLETITGHLMLWGNCYSEIQYDYVGRPIALWPLRPDRMQIYRDPQTLELDYQFSLYRGGVAHLLPQQVLHIRLMSRDGILGLSPVGQNMEAIGLDLALLKYGGKLFGNSAVPIGAITYAKPLQPKQKTDLRNSWNEKYQGLDNAARTALFEDGMGWIPIGMPPEQAQYVQLRGFTLQDMARIYRIPPHLLQELTRSTNNNIEHQGIDFVTYTLRPHITRYEQRIQSRMLKGPGNYYAMLRVDGLLRGDLQSRYSAYAIARQWGWESVNTILAMEDRNPIGPEGDEYLRPLNMVPAGTPLDYAPVKPQPGDGQGPDDGGEGDSQAGRSAIRIVFGDVLQRVARRERNDVLRAAKRYLGKDDVTGFKAWTLDFFAEHRTFIEQQLEPVVNAAHQLKVTEASPADLATRIASRGLGRVNGWIQASATPAQVLPQLEAAYESIEADELEHNELPVPTRSAA